MPVYFLRRLVYLTTFMWGSCGIDHNPSALVWVFFLWVPCLLGSCRHRCVVPTGSLAPFWLWPLVFNSKGKFQEVKVSVCRSLENHTVAKVNTKPPCVSQSPFCRMELANCPCNHCHSLERRKIQKWCEVRRNSHYRLKINLWLLPPDI